MKLKLITLLSMLAVSTVFAVTSVAAETPSVSVTSTPLTAETIGDYGAEMVEGLDAYALQVSLSDVALNRTNAVKVSGTVLTGFELIYQMSEEDYNKIDKDYSLVYDSVYALGTDVFGQSKLTGEYTYTTQLGAPTNNASFPAKNSAVSAEESTVLYTSIIFIPEGESVTFNMSSLSGGFGTFASGNVDSSTQWGFNAVVSPESVNVTGMPITLGKAAPTVAPEYFNASFTAGGPKYNGNKGMKFFFNSSKLNKVASYIFNFDEMFDDPTFESEAEVDVAIKVNNVPEDDTVTLTGYEWSETARVDN